VLTGVGSGQDPVKHSEDHRNQKDEDEKPAAKRNTKDEIVVVMEEIPPLVLEKKVILYGSESNVSIFKSNPDASDYCSVPEPCCSSKNVPIAIVEVVDPIILNTKIKEANDDCGCCCCCCDDVPDKVLSGVSGTLCDNNPSGRYLTVSLGLFSVVRIVRPAQYLVNATEYCVPDKECISTEEDNPCRIFRTMDFPTSEFCPPDYPYSRGEKGGKCGCQG
jgi:hypothetical protein